MTVEGRRVRVRGLVQGVGFRPHVWRLARDAHLAGQVRNDGDGVAIEVWGDPAALERFVGALRSDPPPLARIESVEAKPLAGDAVSAPFYIADSDHGDIHTGIVADAATCPECLREVFDTADRRHRYPFTNCTHCGPRLSIVRSIPYDRANTSMAVFEMCPACQDEYDDPADRRFHAQPNACPNCGPKVWLETSDGPIHCTDPIVETACRLTSGEIVAVKGIGGFHLACDATNENAVANLRARKHRDAKPFAVMVRDMAMARRYADVDDEAVNLLASTAAPIVLLSRRGAPLAAGIAPGQDRIGLIMPYSPLHHLLLHDVGGPIVLTSGNRTDEPQVITNDAARERLAGVADAWLMHDRDIVNRLDDSVVRLDACGPAVLRRGRGLAPEPITLAAPFAKAPRVLAMGGELKSTVCLLRDGQAIVSQHIGDLEVAATHADYRAMLALYRDLFDFTPDVIAVDQHPDYLSSQWGAALADETGARLVSVQHHHAHLVACLAEHGLAPGEESALGIILDGLGYGDDGTFWGGEFLVGGYGGFDRAGHFLPVAMPGGEQAARQPWRNTYAHLRAAFGDDALARVPDGELATFLTAQPLATIDRMIDRGLNSPPASSAGRLFDAVAGAIGLCRDHQAYEAQAAMELEALARPFIADESAYPANIVMGAPLVIGWRPLWEALLADLAAGVEPGRVSARFHLGMCDVVTRAAETIAADRGLNRLVLSGGVLQNQILREGLHARLTAAGFTVLTPCRLPANDGGLSLGQAVAAAGL